MCVNPNNNVDFNRKVFFDAVRVSLFKGRLNDAQVKTMDAVIDYWSGIDQPHYRWLAYILATIYLETGRTMKPVREVGSDRRKENLYGPKGKNPQRAIKHGHTKLGDALIWCGHGLPQLTWKDNYIFQGKKHGLDLVNHPELMLELDISVKVMISGMIDGDFTGVGLSKYLCDGTQNSKGKKDFLNARRIINGTDSARKIAGYAEKFLDAIVKASLVEQPKLNGRKPDAHVVTEEGEVLPEFIEREDESLPGASYPREVELQLLELQQIKAEKRARELTSKHWLKSSTIKTIGVYGVGLVLARFGLNDVISADNLVDLMTTWGLIGLGHLTKKRFDTNKHLTTGGLI